MARPKENLPLVMEAADKNAVLQTLRVYKRWSGESQSYMGPMLADICREWLEQHSEEINEMPSGILHDPKVLTFKDQQVIQISPGIWLRCLGVDTHGVVKMGLSRSKQ